MSGSVDPAAIDVRRRTDGEWPVRLRGVTETVVATLGPNDRWNVAALGVHAPEGDDGDAASTGRDADDADRSAGHAAATATTWGNTRTRRNFRRRGGGVVQFTPDPREFVDAALTIREEPEPVLAGADAWVRVDAERVDAGESGGTRREEWRLAPREGAVRREHPHATNRGYYAVIDATVAASRLDVPSYDTGTLLDRLSYFAETVERCGGPAEREAMRRVDEATGWRDRLDGDGG